MRFIAKFKEVSDDGERAGAWLKPGHAEFPLAGAKGTNWGVNA